MHPRDLKAVLRQSIQERLETLPQRERENESCTVCRQIQKLLPEPPAVIAAYYPLKTEANLRCLFREMRRRGDELYLPRVEGGRIVYRRVESWDTVGPGEYGIPEPPASAPPLDPARLTLALIPGRAFDRAGGRLGRGNGGYDTWIRGQRRANPATRFLGVALERQIVEDVPTEEHDERVDAIVTARGVLECTRKG